MAISRVNTTELRVQVYNYLVDQILNGELKPGDSIAESKLASEFNISRTPVRVAERQLAASGILESKPNCNTTVAKWNDEKILQLEIVRTDMENLAAKLAIIYVCKLSANEIYKNMTKKEETYNEAVEKLRKIVADIENGDLDVDVLSEKVKEATRLIKLCKEKLYKVDEEVKKVLEELE